MKYAFLLPQTFWGRGPLAQKGAQGRIQKRRKRVKVYMYIRGI